MMLILISIHVPAWGTTNWQNNIFYELIYFNPRSRVGNDKVNYEWLTEGTGFQSTFPRGERPNATKSSELPCQFQSTFPRGERPTQMRNNDANHDFNPRSRVGNDHMYCDNCRFNSISIHVPAWGTTNEQSVHYYLSTYFNPRSRVGNDNTQS